MSFDIVNSIKVNLLDVVYGEDDFSRRRGEFLVDALHNCICH